MEGGPLWPVEDDDEGWRWVLIGGRPAPPPPGVPRPAKLGERRPALKLSLLALLVLPPAVPKTSLSLSLSLSRSRSLSRSPSLFALPDGLSPRRREGDPPGDERPSAGYPRERAPPTTAPAPAPGPPDPALAGPAAPAMGDAVLEVGNLGGDPKLRAEPWGEVE